MRRFAKFLCGHSLKMALKIGNLNVEVILEASGGHQCHCQQHEADVNSFNPLDRSVQACKANARTIDSHSPVL